jgi:hypothetical protein
MLFGTCLKCVAHSALCLKTAGEHAAHGAGKMNVEGGGV